MVLRPLVMLAAATGLLWASCSHAEDRSRLEVCQALLQRTGQQSAGSGGPPSSDAEVERCRQMVWEWERRDARMSVDEKGRALPLK